MAKKSMWITKEWPFITRELMAVVLFSVSFLPLFIPISVPIPIDQKTVDFLDEIKKLGPDSVVLWTYPGGYIRKRTATEAVIYSICDTGASIIFANLMPDYGPRGVENCKLQLQYSDLEGKYGYVNGRDYVVLPFLAGEEAAHAALREDMHIFKIDAYGQPIEELPLMQRVHKVSDCDLIISTTGTGVYVYIYVKQWCEPTGVRAIDGCSFPNVAPFYDIYIFGCLDGTRGWAEFESLSGYYGEYVEVIQCNNLKAFATIGLMLLSNVVHLTRKKETKAVEV